MSQRSRAGNPSVHSPESREITSDSVELCETRSLFLADPTDWDESSTSKIHKTPLEVEFESSRSPAMSESWNKSGLQCCAVYAT